MNRALEKCWPQLSAQPVHGSTRRGEKNKIKSFSDTQKWKDIPCLWIERIYIRINIY